MSAALASERLAAGRLEGSGEQAEAQEQDETETTHAHKYWRVMSVSNHRIGTSSRQWRSLLDRH